MRVIVVGLGVQGQKRRRIAAEEVVATVDPIHAEADYRDIEAVPLDRYDAALLCIPDDPKLKMIAWLLGHGKHVLVEKPLFAQNDAAIQALDAMSERTGTVCYTAYNHRFEPHIVGLRDIIQSGALGRIYRARFFYGNGTARDVRNSNWRDTGAGVLPDLGSHLLDTTLFLFGHLPERLKVWSARRFENRSFDHVICGAEGDLLVEYEMTLLSWRNHFVAEVYGELGSAHISSLCKWGPSSLTVHRRILPSGRPTEESRTLVQPDPTWAEEYAHFKALCAAGTGGNLANDLLINRELQALTIAAEQLAPVQ